MRTLTKELQNQITPPKALELLKEGNKRFVNNLKVNRNLLQQVNETRDGQHPFAVIISCMDSRAPAELIFDQGLGDVFSIRVAGNIINEDILGSAEFGCKVVGAKAVVVLGHTKCGAVKGALDQVHLGNLDSVLNKIQYCIPSEDLKFTKLNPEEKMSWLTKANVDHSIEQVRSRSKILHEMEMKGEIKIVGGVYDISTGEVSFFENNK